MVVLFFTNHLLLMTKQEALNDLEEANDLIVESKYMIEDLIPNIIS